MKLSVLVKNLRNKSFFLGDDPEISLVTQDSRQAGVGGLFVAIKGFNSDGHDFLEKVLAAGISAVVAEKPIPGLSRIPHIVVEDSREALEHLAAQFFGGPSKNLFSVGITGTNGKTTTSHIVEDLLNVKYRTAVVGTIDYHLGSTVFPSSHTTPDPLVLQKTLSDFVGMGASALSMEVSSHALELRRAESIQFDVGVFTNLTRDHLDLHHDMDSYAHAKARLFGELLAKSPKKQKLAVYNTEDLWAPKIIGNFAPAWGYGADHGDLRTSELKMSLTQTTGLLRTPMGDQRFEMNLIGRHNVLNFLAATGAALHGGLSLEQITDRIKAFKNVRGRLERVENKQVINVFVDYAHTDDALINVLSFLKSLQKSEKIITVFGCGGDRDKGKRPLMLKAAVKFSDEVVVTSDNPRTEDPERIVDDIFAGAPKTKATVHREVDRKKGIALALSLAKKNDVVLIAGKGHEDYQIIGTTKFPFDDVQIARAHLGDKV